MTDLELAKHIEQEGSWEQALREAQAATIARNVARWRLAQEKRERKDRLDSLEAERRGLSLRGLKDLRRHEYQLRNCRATLGEIVAAHSPKVKR